VILYMKAYAGPDPDTPPYFYARIFLRLLRSIKLIAIALTGLSFMISSASALPTRPIDLLVNGDFSNLRDGIPSDWGLAPGAKASKDGPNGHPSLSITTPIQQYSMACQYIPIDGRRVRKVRFSGRLKFDKVVRGQNPYDTLRAFIIWFDAHGKQNPNFANGGFWTGSSGWVSFDKTFDVPADARRGQVLMGLHSCIGNCAFADLKLTVTDGDRNFDPADSAKTDTRGWWPFVCDETPAEGTPIDVSYLLDKPAGKHGFLTARDGHLFFQDGTRARFWGFDVVASECFLDHKSSAKLAERIARMGGNIVRLHHMDASWADPNIFDPKFDDTRHLSATSMDNLDFFLSELKKRGIYVYLDWLVNRHFMKGDGVTDYALVDDGAKIVAHYDPRMIELQKEYMRNLLCHKNAYTGVRYVDEPQIALSEVINEDSVFYADWYYRVPPRYMKELQKLCAEYDPKADPSKQPFDDHTIRALYQIESKYYREMRAYLRQLGLKCPTTGSNHWENLGAGLLCDSETDYIDRHFYWDHPKDGFGWFQEFDNTPMLMDTTESLPLDLASTRISGEPMVVTEWCFCWINDYCAEGPIFGTVNACQQDWDAMLWFDLTSKLPSSAMENEFDIANKPHIFAQSAAAAIAFHRQDFTPLTATMQGEISRNELLKGSPLSDAVNLDLTPAKRTSISISDDKTKSKGSRITLSPGNDPGAAQWDVENGVLTAESPRSIAIDGFTGGRDFDFGWLSIKMRSDFSAVWLTSLDGKPLRDSDDVLVTLAARATNTGMEFNPARTHLVKPGTAPVLVEPVAADLTFPNDVMCTPLNQDGTPRKPIIAHSMRLGEDRTFWYEIRRGK